jgi:hypothetical protein
MAFVDASHGGEDLAWRAVSALKRIMIDEGLLHRMQCAVGLGEALDGRDIFALHAGSQGEARQNAASVDQHSASAALTVIATLLAAGKTGVLAKRVEQRGADVERKLVLPIIYCCTGNERIAWICRGGGGGSCGRIIKQSGLHCRCYRGCEKIPAAPRGTAVCMRHHRDLQALRSENGRPFTQNVVSRLLFPSVTRSWLASRVPRPATLRMWSARYDGDRRLPCIPRVVPKAGPDKANKLRRQPKICAAS